MSTMENIRLIARAPWVNSIENLFERGKSAILMEIVMKMVECKMCCYIVAVSEAVVSIFLWQFVLTSVV